MAEVIHDGVFIFHAATVVCLAEVLDLPCLVYFLRHGVIEVTIKQKNILVIESRLTKFCGYVLLSTLGLREDNDLLWNSLFLLVIKSYLYGSLQGIDLSVCLDALSHIDDDVYLFEFSLDELLLNNGILILGLLKARLIDLILNIAPEKVEALLCVCGLTAFV